VSVVLAVPRELGVLEFEFFYLELVPFEIDSFPTIADHASSDVGSESYSLSENFTPRPIVHPSFFS